MSDLISRSALMESLIHCDGLGRKSFEAVIKTIENQPTAYNVDKVVEELDKEKVFMIDEYTEEHEVVVFLDEAIEIVKGGGVNAIRSDD